MYSLKEKVAVVTGAGSGIGRGLALALDRRGCRLAIADINEENLKATAAMLSRPALVQRLDVADRGDVYAFAERVQAELGGAQLVINNAGVAVSQFIKDLEYADFEWLMGINFWGVVYGTKAFLPQLLGRNDGAVVNISSVFGIISVPGQGAYNAAKFAVRGFTEALRHELASTNVKSICVHPGGIKTNIVKHARVYVDQHGASSNVGSADELFQRLAKTTPDQAAETIVSGIENGKVRILIGGDAHFIDWIQRLFPVRYWTALRRVMDAMSR